MEHAVGIGQLPPVLHVVAVGFRRAGEPPYGDVAFTLIGGHAPLSLSARL